jgi:hypothetical protein
MKNERTMSSLKESFQTVAKESAGKILIGISAGLLLATIALATGKNSTQPVSTGTNEDSSTATETPPEDENTLSLRTAWNSAENKRALEYQIKHYTANSMTGASQSIASVSCNATTTQPIWKCKIRKLGETESYYSRVEVDYENDNWASTQWQ